MSATAADDDNDAIEEPCLHDWRYIPPVGGIIPQRRICDSCGLRQRIRWARDDRDVKE